VFKINVLAATIKDCYQALAVARRGGGGKAAVADLMESIAVFILPLDQVRGKFPHNSQIAALPSLLHPGGRATAAASFISVTIHPTNVATRTG
jgi:hypothetical protein